MGVSIVYLSCASVLLDTATPAPLYMPKSPEEKKICAFKSGTGLTFALKSCNPRCKLPLKQGYYTLLDNTSSTPC